MITIIGSGKVGGDAALFSALKRLDDQILLLDVNQKAFHRERQWISTICYLSKELMLK